MQLKEYFEKYEIDLYKWCKRHQLRSDLVQLYFNGKAFPEKPIRDFIEKCTFGQVSEADWLDLRYLGPDACKQRAIEREQLALQKQNSLKAKEHDHLVADLREDALQA